MTLNYMYTIAYLGPGVAAHKKLSGRTHTHTSNASIIIFVKAVSESLCSIFDIVQVFLASLF